MIYFIQDAASTHIKIGHSSDPWKRFTQIKTSSSSDLRLLKVSEGGRAEEAALHEEFAALRVRREWFLPSEALLQRIARSPALTPTPVRTTKRASTHAGIRELWNGHSTTEVASLTGISLTMVSQIATGARKPSPQNAITIQRATGVSAIKLVFGDLASEAA